MKFRKEQFILNAIPLYKRFFPKNQDKPEFFVSIIKEKNLASQKDLDRLIRMGVNPLAEMLGIDESSASGE